MKNYISDTNAVHNLKTNELENRIKELELELSDLKSEIIVDKQVEMMLRESESSLRNAQEIARMGNWELNINNQKTKWSENCYVIYGLKPFEIEPTFEYFKSRIHPDDMHLIDEAFENIVRYKLPHTSEMRIIFPDGTFKWFQNNMIPVFKDDKLVALKGINLDITELKKAEEELILKTLIFDSSIAANSISDNEGNITHCNSAFLKIWGYDSKDEVIGKPIPFFIKNEDEALKIIASLNEPGIWEGEYTGLKKDRTTFNAYGLATIIQDKKKENIGYFSAVIDITERKQAELALKEYERELHQLNLDKDRFISILGHDLKSPINNLLGLSEVLTDEITNLETEEIEDIAKDIHKSAKIVNKLLDDILLWARAQQGKIPFKPQILSFKDICKDTLEILTTNANAKNITINYSSADHIYVFADVDMLKTVVRNLVSNAIKFSNSGSKINVSAEQTELSITISVSDNGIGITPDNLAKLFDISQVLTTTGTAKEKGTGLGLILCKEFVEKHGGKIWVESEEGKGSDFRFTLPKFSERANDINN